MMPLAPHEKSWPYKFGVAWRGLKLGVHGQSSFFVHFFVAVMVLVAGAVMDVTLTEWCILALCIQSVITAELFNSAIEWLAKAVSDEHHPQVGGALDIASAAVLTAALGASLVGTLIFVHRLGVLLDWWESLV